MTSDDRMSWDLTIDVLKVLERHGFHGRDSEHTGQAICMIDDPSRLREAEAYDRMAAQMLHHTAQAANARQPEPGSPGQADPGADKEAGQ
jgi:hypothetical protein